MTGRKAAGKRPPSARKGKAAGPRIWVLRLYIAGMTPRARAALDNLKEICEARLAGVYRIEVVDLLEDPQLARGDQILAVPTLVRQLPEPAKRMIGDLSSTERILVGLDLFGEERT